MKVRIKQREFDKWPSDVRRKLMRLTIRDWSGMRDALHDRPENVDRTFVLFEDETPVAWAMLCWCKTSRAYDLMIYTRRNRRRRGYGRKLVKAVDKWLDYEKYDVFCDPENISFFETVGKA